MTEDEQKYTFTAWLHQHKPLLYKVVRSYVFSEAELSLAEAKASGVASTQDYRGTIRP
ncbi:MAG: hypothetical protein ACNA8K_10320 [Cyclonatronaceae bacterium]